MQITRNNHKTELTDFFETLFYNIQHTRVGSRDFDDRKDPWQPLSKTRASHRTHLWGVGIHDNSG